MSEKVKVWCYRRWKEYGRAEAEKLFGAGMMASGGSEMARYVAILIQLRAGRKVCTDYVYASESEREEVEKMIG